MKERIKDKTKINIVRSAAKLIKENGYHNVTVRDICKDANVSLSAVNYNFGSKDNLDYQLTQLLPSAINKTIDSCYPELQRFNPLRDLVFTLILVDSLFVQNEFMDEYRAMFSKPSIQRILAQSLSGWFQAYHSKFGKDASEQLLAIYSHSFSVALVSLVSPGTYEVTKKDVDTTKRVVSNLFFIYLRVHDFRAEIERKAYELASNIKIEMNGFFDFNIKYKDETVEGL